MKRLLWLSLMIILITALVLGGCSKAAPSTTSAAVTPSPARPTSAATTTAAASQPQYGGVLKIISAPGVVNLGQPDAAAGSFDDVFRMPCGEALVGRDTEGKNKIVPQLATGWQISPDFTSITFTLRKGVKFQDGTDFNSAAAKYNLDLYKAAKGGARAMLALMTSVDVIDDYTLRIGLSKYDPAILSTANGPGLVMMMSPTALKALGNDALLHPVGTGPYKFSSYKTDVSLKYERFDGYWQGKPYLDGLEFVFIADPVTRMLSLQSGEAQAVRSLTAKDASDLKATGKFSINAVCLGMEGLVTDTAHSDSPFFDIRVRQAVSYAINNDAISKAVGYGFSPPVVNQQIVTQTNYAFNPAVVGYPFNPQKAKELLAAAGRPNGIDTTLTFRTDPSALAMFTMVQSYLKDVGINVKLDPADSARYSQVRASGWNNQLLHFGFVSSPEEDSLAWLRDRLSNTSSWFVSSSLATPADYNAKLVAASYETDPDKRKAMAQDLMKMITDQYCLANPCYFSTALAASDSQVHNFDLHKFYNNTWYPYGTWLSK
jgi:peptide/nickel transport system substrate-binding protein